MITASNQFTQAWPFVGQLAYIGGFVWKKYQTRVQEVEALRKENREGESGYYVVAKQLKKQGYPIEITLAILFNR